MTRLHLSPTSFIINILYRSDKNIFKMNYDKEVACYQMAFNDDYFWA